MAGIICTRCAIEKEPHFFSVEKTGYRRKVCKTCRTKAVTKYRATEGKTKARDLAQKFRNNHPGYYAQYLSDSRLKQMREGLERARVRNKSVVEAAKAKPCVDCGVQYPPQSMDFDHVRGPKLGCVSTLAGQAASLKRLNEEIAKCEVVCSNCHRARTASRRLSNAIR